MHSVHELLERDTLLDEVVNEKSVVVAIELGVSRRVAGRRRHRASDECGARWRKK
jgi:hypothetical protein